LEQAIANSNTPIVSSNTITSTEMPNNYKVTIGDGIDLNEVTPIQATKPKTKSSTNPKKKNKNKG